MVTVNEINQTILSGSLSYDQLNSIAMAMKLARSQMLARKTVEFKPGDKVQFTCGARYFTGVVQNIMRKNVLVQTTNGLYRVPALMLKAA
jgi:hypothetical protein